MTRSRRSVRGDAISRALPRSLAGLLAASLGLAAALLVACGSSNKSLIPVADSGPLQGDVQAVLEAAKTGDGDCAATEAALLKLSRDFTALPLSVDAGLRNNLRQGIDNLRVVALAECRHSTTPTTTTTTPKTTTTTTTPTTTETQATTTATTPETPPPSETPGGGTPAPGETPEEPGGTGAGEGGAGGAPSEAGGTGPGSSGEGK
jgi:hypothetical protein